jgi:hypothetical protein
MPNGIVWTIYIMIAIPGVIICTVGLLYYMHQSEPYVKARIKGEEQRKQQAVLERRTETITEKVVIELVPNEALSQHLTNLTGSLDHHAQVIEKTAQIIPLSQPVPSEIQEKVVEKPVQEVSARVSELSPEGADRQIIKEYLDEHPQATVRETARAVGMGKTKVGDIMKELKGGTTEQNVKNIRVPGIQA